MAVLESSMAGKKSKHTKKDKKKTLLLAQDVHYARNLASNDEKVRNRSLKYLKKYLEQRSQASPLTEDNLKVLWKGLFFSLWMADKPLVQEACAENIAHLIHCLQFDEAMLFFKFGLVTLQNEWIGIDQLRLDKFLMFVRRLLRQALFVLEKFNFTKHPNELFAKTLEDTILSTTKITPLGLVMHFTEIYLEEIAKVSNGKLQSSRTLDLLKPYITKLAFATDNRTIQWITKFIFTHLMKQHKLGLEYEDKYKIWKMHGFEGSINQIQKVLVPEEEWEEEGEGGSNNEKPKQSLDPRAGRVNVELPQILFNAKDIADALLEPKSNPRSSKLTRALLTVWAERYQKLHNGIYPLGVKRLGSKKRKNLDGYDTNVSKAAKRLIKFEQQLLAKEEGTNKRKIGDSYSQNEDPDSDIPKKKKKKNLQTDDIDKDDSVSNKKKHKKEKDALNKINSNSKTSNLDTIKKSKEKTTLLESKIKKDKNVLRKKIQENEVKPKESSYLPGTVAIDQESYCFERNSGVWHVTAESLDQEGNADCVPVASWDCSPVPGPLDEASPKVQNKRSPKRSSLMDSSNQTPNPTIEAMDDEGYEFFIPSKKFVKRLRKTKSDEEVELVLGKLRGKSRTSMNNLSRKQNLNEITPTKRTPKTGSPKKVVINTKLNVSQEIDDHILQVISSPQVPWDSSKKPGKPLLKTPLQASPINPFYRLKIF